MKTSTGVPATVLLVGAGSEIGWELISSWLAIGTQRLVLTTRSGVAPDVIAAAESRAVSVSCVTIDVTAPASVTSGVAGAWAGGDVDVAVIAVGVLGDQSEIEQHPERALDVFAVNTAGTAHVALEVANRFEQQGHGTLILLSSVAGQRGRRDNYVYGASKAALDTFAEGLEQRLRESGVRVMTVRPGYVFSKMSAGVEPAPLAVTLTESRDAILTAYARGDSVVYVPASLRVVFGVIRLLPRRLWARTVRWLR